MTVFGFILLSERMIDFYKVVALGGGLWIGYKMIWAMRDIKSDISQIRQDQMTLNVALANLNVAVQDLTVSMRQIRAQIQAQRDIRLIKNVVAKNLLI